MSSFKLISAHASLAKFYLDWTPCGRRIPLIKNGSSVKDLRGSWGFTPKQGDLSFTLTSLLSISRSHTSNETIGKWVWLMWGVGTLSGAVITVKLQNWKFEHWCGLLLHKCNNKMGPCVTFSGIKENFFDPSKLVKWPAYTRLVTLLHSYSDPSTLVYTRLHSSSNSSVFLKWIFNLCKSCYQAILQR